MNTTGHKSAASGSSPLSVNQGNSVNDDDIAPSGLFTPLSKTPFIKRGTPQFIRVTLALFSAGLATFALLYCVQPILPVLSQDFGVSPATSSLSTFSGTRQRYGIS